MRILQVNVSYKEGSTGQIVFNLHNYLRQNGHESIICYGRGSYFNEENVYKTSSELGAKLSVLWGRLNGVQYGGCTLATNRIIQIIKIEKPDIVHLHCINGNMVNIYRLISWLKENNVKTLITLHAEFFYTGSCGHAFDCEKWMTGCGDCPQLWDATKSYLFDKTRFLWEKMSNVFLGFEKKLVVVSVSPWLHERAIRSPILRNKRHYVIMNGIDSEYVFRPSPFNKIKERHKLTNEKVILHVTASFAINAGTLKGGYFVLELAKRLIDKNIKIIIIGGRMQKVELPRNVINIGRVEDQKELSAYYSMADLSIITSKRETFSMVCAESLSCGTPVVGFRAGGPETISLNKYSEFVKYGDMDAFEKVVLKWLNMKTSGISLSLAATARKTYSRDKMGSEYIKLYKAMNNNNYQKES